MKISSPEMASRWDMLVFKLSIAVLILSGLAQMPIFKRYYISEIPGLGWTADYQFNHVLHYIAAAILLIVLFKWVITYLKTRNYSMKLSLSGKIRIILFLIIIVTGFFRAYKNLPDYYFSPLATTAIIWAHLAAGLLLGIVAVYSRLSGRRYFSRR
ncbi:MAG: hypothetical protein ABR533_08790 [Desulfonatronovibrio sp.]